MVSKKGIEKGIRSFETNKTTMGALHGKDLGLGRKTTFHFEPAFCCFPAVPEEDDDEEVAHKR